MRQWIDTDGLNDDAPEAVESALFWAEYREALLRGGIVPPEPPDELINDLKTDPYLALEVEYATAKALAWMAVAEFGKALQRHNLDGAAQMVDEYGEAILDPDTPEAYPLEWAVKVLMDWGPYQGAYNVLSQYVPGVGLADMDEFRAHLDWWVRASHALAETLATDSEESVVEALLEGSLETAEEIAGMKERS